MPTRLPLFPLDVVLFPGEVLPLHIFEPRYRRMLADVLEGDRRFGLTPVGADGGPDEGAVGCVAEVRAIRPLPDGRSNIVVVGAERFTVERVLGDDPAPYAVGLVESFDDEPDTLPAPDEVARLAALHARFADALRRLEDVSAETPSETPPTDAGDIRARSFEASAALQTDEATKRRLLATRDTAERVGLLLRLLPALVETAEAAALVHERAPTNGRGREGDTA